MTDTDNKSAVLGWWLPGFLSGIAVSAIVWLIVGIVTGWPR